MGETTRSDAPVADPSAESRTEIEVEGARWSVEVAGRSRSGTAPDSGAPLLLLRFRRGGEEAEGHGEGAARAREAWAVGVSLAGFSRLQLAEILARSRPEPSEGRD
jgi:hypothetical protein